jgi:transposase
MNSYSGDLRERVIKQREGGWSAQECERCFHVSKRSVERWWKRWIENGERKARQIGGGRTSRLKPHERAVRAWIAQKPDLTLEETCARLRREKGVLLRKSALAHQLARMGLSFKKNSARRRAVASRRAAWACEVEKNAPAAQRAPAGLPR